MNIKQKSLNDTLLNAYKDAYQNPKDSLLRYIASLNQIIPTKLHICFVKDQATSIHNTGEGLAAPLYDRIDSSFTFLYTDTDEEDSDLVEREVTRSRSNKAPITAAASQTIGDISSKPLSHSWLQSLFVSLVTRFKFQRDGLTEYYQAPADERIYLERDLSKKSTICIAIKNVAIFFLKVNSSASIPISVRVEPYNSHSRDDFHFNEIKAGAEFLRSMLMKSGYNDGSLLSYIYCFTSYVTLLFEQKCAYQECPHGSLKPPSVMMIQNQRNLYFHYECYVNYSNKQ